MINPYSSSPTTPISSSGTTTTTTKAIRLLLVGDASVGKTTFAKQLTTALSQQQQQQQQQQAPTIGAKLYSHTHHYQQQQQQHSPAASSSTTTEYFVDWLDIGAKYFDSLRANQIFFHSSSYHGIVFMFDMYDSSSLQFWDKIDQLVSTSMRMGSNPNPSAHTTTTPHVTLSSSSSYLPTTVTSRRPQPQPQQQPFMTTTTDHNNYGVKRRSVFGSFGDVDLESDVNSSNGAITGPVPILIIGNHCSHFTAHDSSGATLELPLLESYGSKSLIDGARSSQSFIGRLFHCFSTSLLLLSKILLLGDYFPSDETSHRNIANARSLANKLQTYLNADYMELNTPQLTASQKRLIDNFIDRVIIQSGYEKAI